MSYIYIFTELFRTRKQSETADLCQRHVVRQVTAPYSVWQRFLLCPIESNVNKNFKVIQNPGFLPDYPQNWITGSFCHSWHSQKMSERSVHKFLSYLADTQTDKVWQKHNLLGGGYYCFLLLNVIITKTSVVVFMHTVKLLIQAGSHIVAGSLIQAGGLRLMF